MSIHGEEIPQIPCRPPQIPSRPHQIPSRPHQIPEPFLLLPIKAVRCLVVSWAAKGLQVEADGRKISAEVCSTKCRMEQVIDSSHGRGEGGWHSAPERQESVSE